AGALLQGDPGRLLAPLVTAGVTGAYPQAEVTVLDTEPVLGAVMGALELAGVTVDDEVAATLRTSWQTAEAAALPGPRPDRGLKVTVVGGGSTYTPELVSGLVDARDAFPLRELVLMDIDPARLEAVGGLAGRMLEDAGLGKALRLSGDLDEALRGADYVVVQIRVGGLPARVLDERIPLELGCIGQETVGAGGISCALRTVPVVLDIARRMERLCPEAWLINFTNPSGLVTEALYRHADVRAVGLCNVPITMRKALAAALLGTGAAGTGDGGPGVDYVGLNHLGWFVGVRDEQGRELLPLILSGHLSQVAERVEVDADLIAAWGAIPNPYLRYYCHPDRALARMKAAGRTRAEEVTELEARLLEMYRNPGLRRRPRELDGRGGAYYSLAAVELMLSLAGIRPGEHVVSVPHRGKIPELPGDTVAELTCRVDRDEITPAPAGTLTPAASGGTLPPGTAGLVRTVKECELLAIEAAVRGSRPLAYLALASHPLVPSAGVARELLERLLEAHAGYLPPGLRA
ncbi:MAG: 6-phospho-beta-glucosidase, partial [Bacillota bacterium]